MQRNGHASKAGNLKSTRQQNVMVGDRVTIIEARRAQVEFVPCYDPALVFAISLRTEIEYPAAWSASIA